MNPFELLNEQAKFVVNQISDIETGVADATDIEPDEEETLPDDDEDKYKDEDQAINDDL